MGYSNSQVIAPVTTLGEPSSSKSNALLLQNRPPETLSAATAQIIAEAIDGWRDLSAPSMVPSQVGTTETTHAAFL